MKSCILIGLLCLPILGVCQWNGSTTTTGNTYRNGNVGIGTDVPTSPLHILGINAEIPPVLISSADAEMKFTRHSLDFTSKSNFNYVPYIGWHTKTGVRQAYLGWRNDVFNLSLENGFNFSINGGNVGVGTTTPRGKFDVDGPGDIYLADDVNTGTSQSVFLPGHIYVAPYNGSDVSYLQARRADNSGTTALQIRTYSGGNLIDAMHISGNGNIGIGTITPGSFKLAVNGKIWSQEVNVAMTNPGPDYVFEPDYDLPSLSEIESYIKQNTYPKFPLQNKWKQKDLI